MRREHVGVAVDNAESFAQARPTLAKDPSLRARLGRARRDVVERLLTWSHIADRIEACYRSLNRKGP
jgi:glycosyltransferase involved in cell wall biosynthesis